MSYNTTETNCACDTLVSVKRSSYLLALMPAFFLMWYRLRIIYRQINCSQLKKKAMKLISGASMVCMVCYSVVSVLKKRSSYMLTPAVFHASRGNKISFGKIPNSVLLSISWIVMIGLLVYLLVTAESTQNLTNRLIRRVIKRSAFSLLACVFSSIITSLITSLVFPKSWLRYPTSAFHNFSFVIDSVSIVTSYLDSGKILFSWLPTVIKRKQPVTITTVVF